MAESMYLGKPVIGTAYSGNMEFMNGQNACLVPYSLVPVAPGAYPYYEGQVWAEPDVTIAAAWMVRLLNEPDFRSEIGRCAASYMRQHHSRAVMAQALSRRLEEIRSERTH